MGGSHETPFKMKGSSLYGLGNSSPAKDRETWSSAAHRDEAADHNKLKATKSHFGDPHGPKPTEDGKTTEESGFGKPITDAEGNVITE